MQDLQENFSTRSGFVALVGRPNVGKSSLLNNLIGQKIAIVSPKVQTTRTKILGVFNYPKQTGQVVFIDLPGIHKPVDKLGESCLKISQDGAKEADLIIFMSEANHSPGKGDQWITAWLAENCSEIPHLILLNKVDLARDERRLKKDEEKYLELFNFLPSKPELLKVSAKNSDGLKELQEQIWKHLQPGPIYFPEDAPTNRSVRFMCSELIREQVLLSTEEEVPHSAAVNIEDFEEGDLVRIRAHILVETKSQKGIIIGKGGSMIKEIGTNARHEIEKLVGKQVFLDLKVKVAAGWRQNQREINRFGYTSEE